MGLFSLAYLSAPWTTLSQGRRGRYTGSRFPPPHRGIVGTKDISRTWQDQIWLSHTLNSENLSNALSPYGSAPNTCCDTTDDRAGDTDTRAILRDFGVSHSEPTLIYEDCQGQSCVHSYVRQAQVAPNRYPEASISAGLVDIRRTCVWEDPF
jgi:hypothetical protein